jgi:nucleotide-binding universal stress UspA family protein
LLPPTDMKRILVAVDGSVRAPHVVAAGIRLARLTGAAVCIYHALSVPQDFPPAAATSGDPLPSLMERAAHAKIRNLIAPYPDVACDVAITHSHNPARAILDASITYRADLIVIGSHGYNVVERLLGTTAATIVNTATRDVLVVHSQLASR